MILWLRIGYQDGDGSPMQTHRSLSPNRMLSCSARYPVQQPAADCLVKPMRWSNCRSGSRPASEVSGASQTSIGMGKGSKKR
jgi:hypothetical protein